MGAVLRVARHGGVRVHDLVPLTALADLGLLPLAVALVLLLALTLVCADGGTRHALTGHGAVTDGRGWAYSRAGELSELRKKTPRIHVLTCTHIYTHPHRPNCARKHMGTQVRKQEHMCMNKPGVFCMHVCIFQLLAAMHRQSMDNGITQAGTFSVCTD